MKRHQLNKSKVRGSKAWSAGGNVGSRTIWLDLGLNLDPLLSVWL